jgi:hypothetical protein
MGKHHSNTLRKSKAQMKNLKTKEMKEGIRESSEYERQNTCCIVEKSLKKEKKARDRTKT